MQDLRYIAPSVFLFAIDGRREEGANSKEIMEEGGGDSVNMIKKEGSGRTGELRSQVVGIPNGTRVAQKGSTRHAAEGALSWCETAGERKQGETMKEGRHERR